jgi:hypothetical protein
MGILSKANLDAFVIRLWCDCEHEQWRGHITHIQTQQDCYFSSMEQLENFMINFLPNTIQAEVA